MPEMTRTIWPGTWGMRQQARKTATRVTGPQDPALVRAFFNDVRLAPFWLALRVVLGWFWLQAGWHWLQATSWSGLSPVTTGAGIVGDTPAIALTLIGVALILG